MTIVEALHNLAKAFGGTSDSKTASEAIEDVATAVEAGGGGGTDQYPSYDVVFSFGANDWTMTAKKGTRADVLSIAQSGGFVRTMIEETVVPTGETRTVYITGFECNISVNGDVVEIFHPCKDTNMQDTTALWLWDTSGEIIDNS